MFLEALVGAQLLMTGEKPGKDNMGDFARFDCQS